MAVIMVYLKEGHPVEERTLEEIERLIEQPVSPFWLDLISPTGSELDWLGETFKFHPLTIEDLRGQNPRPKLEDYPGYIFIVAHSALMRADGGGLGLVELHIFASKQYIITSHAQELEGHEEFQHGFTEKAAWLPRGTDFCLYRLLDNLTDGYLEVVNDIDDELDELQDEILSTGLRNIEPIVTIRRQLATLRRIVSPLREIASELSLHSYPFIRSQTLLYFRDVHSLLVTIFDMSETQRDVASNILDAHLSTISNRLNDVMKRLTVVATVFLPLSFIASFGGMNFTRLPFESLWFFALTMASLIVTTIAMVMWFRREGWF